MFDAYFTILILAVDNYFLNYLIRLYLMTLSTTEHRIYWYGLSVTACSCTRSTTK
jgi:hypothetical protein